MQKFTQKWKALAFIAVFTFYMAGTVSAAIPKVSRSDIISYAKTAVGSWYVWGGDKWDPNNRSWGGADCSGLVLKAWRIPYAASYKKSVGHPYSTYHFYHQSTHWYTISSSQIQAGDCYVRRNSSGGHIFMYHKKNNWGKPLFYEAWKTGTRIRYGTRTVYNTYKVIRRKNLSSSSTSTSTPSPTPSQPSTGTPSASSPTPAVRVTASTLNVRSGPSTGYRVVGRVSRNQVYIAVATSGQWVKIYFGGSTAWVHGNYLAIAGSTSKLYINASWLNVRTGPSTGYRKVGQTSKGKVYAIVGYSGKWRKIWFDGSARWVYAGSSYASQI